jgi:transcriptional regulator with XRE-family HTH domain
MEVIEMQFGDKLKYLRKQRGLTLKYLAECLEVSQPYISKLEKKEKPPNSIEMIAKLGNCLNVDPTYFFDSKETVKQIFGNFNDMQITKIIEVKQLLEQDGIYFMDITAQDIVKALKFVYSLRHDK